MDFKDFFLTKNCRKKNLKSAGPVDFKGFFLDKREEETKNLKSTGPAYFRNFLWNSGFKFIFSKKK